MEPVHEPLPPVALEMTGPRRLAFRAQLHAGISRGPGAVHGNAIRQCGGSFSDRPLDLALETESVVLFR